MSIKVWFTGDQHFGHTSSKGGVIKYCNRPYANVATMDYDLIYQWNAVVKEDDIIYHLGDFTLGDDIWQYAPQLKGNVSILTNSWHHDKRWLKEYYAGKKLPTNFQLLRAMEVIEAHSRWFNVLASYSLSLLPVPIVLCHYPLAVWDRKHYSAWHLHGHSHGNYHAPGKILDVGVDNAYKLLGAYRPFELNEVKEIMDRLDE